MSKRRIVSISIVLLVLLVAMFVPYRTASAAPAITSVAAVPNMVSLFGDTSAQTRNSPFGPSWTRLVVATTGATGVTAKLGDFITAIMPANARSRALSTANWDAMITAFNNTALSNAGLPAGVYATATSTGGLASVTMENILGAVMPQFSTFDARRIVENELQTGAQTITVSATDGVSTVTSTVTVWVVDAQVMLRQGWNLRSSPMALSDSWGAILALGNRTSILAGLKFNSASGGWQVLGASDTVSSLDGVYIYATQNDSIGSRLFRSTAGVVAPASKSLYRGAWNLVGTAPDFTQNFGVVNPSKMRGYLPVTTALLSTPSWVTAISPGETSVPVMMTYTNSGATLGSYTWDFASPSWTFTNGVDSVPASIVVSEADGTGVSTAPGASWGAGATRTLTVTAGGTFNITMPAGVSGMAVSGTATVVGSPVTLAAGATTTVNTGATTGTFTVTSTAKGWTLPFSGYWVFIPTDSGGLVTPVVLAGQNTGVLTDAWLLQLLTLGP